MISCSKMQINCEPPPSTAAELKSRSVAHEKMGSKEMERCESRKI